MSQEEFKEEGGLRWFATGDIGCIEEDGALKIIGVVCFLFFCCNFG